MFSLKALSFCLLVGVAAAQYNYKQPEAPKNTYLPPTTKAPYESDKQVAAEGLGPDGEHEPGMPFDFSYAVKEDDGNDFSHQAESDGDVVKGEYRILLPDGRTQVVKYTADWKNGYNAEVTFEGEAVYPEPKPTQPPAPRPTQPPRPKPTTRDPYANQADNDSQGLLPPSTPGYNYPKPTTTRRPPPPPPPPTTRRPLPPPPPPTTRRPLPPPPPPTTRRTQPPPPPPTQGYNYPKPTTRPPPPPTTRRTPPPPPPTEPPGLYGAPSVPFGVRVNPKFGYSK